MSGLFFLGIFAVLWGLAVLLIAVLKPAKIWQMGKIQGFVKIMGDKGATILFIVLGIAVLAVGVWLVYFRLIT